MGFGADLSSQAKANDAGIKGVNTDLSGMFGNSQARMGQAFKGFSNAAGLDLSYLKNLMTSDVSGLTKVLSPELSGITNMFSGARQKNAIFAPRGGGQASGNNATDVAEAQQKSNLFTSVRPMAAQQLGSLAGVFGSQSLGQGGLALGATGQQASNLFGLNKEQLTEQQMRNEAWQGLGQGLGQLAGIGLGKIPCCFILLEATNGNLPTHVRQLRDYYYELDPQVAVGYMRSAKLLVPLMRHSKWFKKLINNYMVVPIIEYGAFLKHLSPYNRHDHLIKSIWFSIWRFIGRY